MSEVVYEVLTEFVFDVRGAINNSAALKGAVDNISSAADGAFLSLHKLADFASHGLGLNLSVMGVLGGAFASFDKFKKTQISFANIIASNMSHLTGNVETFNDKLDVSKTIMKDVAKIAREYSLDESAMMGTTKTLAAFLTPHGLSGKNMGNAVNMARMFEKSAPMLGIDTGQAQGELIRSISGQASMGDTLFRRLATEAPEYMGKYAGSQNGMMHHRGGGGAQMFNMLPMAKRFELLSKAMGKFSNNAEVNAANAELLSNKLRVLKNEFIGFDGVLLPLGEVLTNNIKPVLTKLIGFVETIGRPALVKFSEALQKAFENPEKIYATIRQLQGARANFQEAIHLTHVFGEVLFGLWIIKLPLVRAAMLSVLGPLSMIGGLMGRFAASLLGMVEMDSILGILTNGMKLFGFIANGLVFIFMRFIAPLAVIFAFLQLISRAKGYAEANDAKALMANGGKLGSVMVGLSKNLYKIIAPFEMMFDNIARGIAPLFQYSTYLQFLVDNMGTIVAATDTVAKYMLFTAGVIVGVGAVLRQSAIEIVNTFEEMFKNLGIVLLDWPQKLVQRFEETMKMLMQGDFAMAKQHATSPLNMPMPTNNVEIMDKPELYRTAALGFVDMFQAKMNDPNAKDKSVTSHTTNIGNVNIRQDFKENMEPDRIAHSFVQVLRGVAINPTQASGKSFSGAMVGR
jgi:hypothetical protein